MKDQDFQTLVDIISGDRPPRVWSLLVTVFGELAQETPSMVSGTILSGLTGLLGIRPEAMRVALHRLRKDGWIENQRDGRTSTYRLTQWGHNQSAIANPRIYAATSPNLETWLVHFDPALPFDSAEKVGISITPSMSVCTHPPNTPETLSTKMVAGGDVPAWLRAKICEPEISAKSKNLASKLATLDKEITDTDDLTALQIAAIRILIVHTWRRIVLKVPDLPDEIFPTDWAGSECRMLVSNLLQTLPKQSLLALQTQVTKPVRLRNSKISKETAARA